MIKKITLLITIFTNILLFSQSNYNTTVSDVIKNEENYSKARGSYFQRSTIIADNNGGFFSVKMNSKGVPIQTPKSYSIYHYDNELKLISSSEYMIKRKSAFLSGAFIDGKKIKIIHRVPSKTAKKSYDFEVITSSIDSDNFENSILMTVSKKNAFFIPKRSNSLIKDGLPTGIFNSKNNNFFSIVEKNELNKNTIELSINVFNHKMEKVYAQKIKFEGEKPSIRTFDLDDENGNVYIQTFRGDKTKVRNFYLVNQSIAKELPFSNDFLYYQPKFISLNEENFTCINIARNKKNEKFGISIKIFKKDGSLQHSKFTEFSDQFIKDIYKKVRPIKFGDINYLLDFITTDSEKNIYIAGQIYKRPTSGTIQNGLGSYSTFNYPAIFNNILISKFSNKGELIYSRNIKNQIGKANFIVNQNQLNIIAKGRNSITKANFNYFGGDKKPSLYLSKIDNEGNIESLENLFKNDQLKVDLSPNSSFLNLYSKNKKMLITKLGEEKNKRQYLKIDF